MLLRLPGVHERGCRNGKKSLGSHSCSCSEMTAPCLVSVTRLRLRSRFFLIPLAFRTEIIARRQLLRSRGFLGGKLLADKNRVFWTMTTWSDESSMRSFERSGIHKNAMPSLRRWCDEAAVTHWISNEKGIPNWMEAHRYLSKDPKMSPLDHPSQSHLSKQFAPPVWTSRKERILKPA